MVKMRGGGQIAQDILSGTEALEHSRKNEEVTEARASRKVGMKVCQKVRYMVSRGGGL